jgi:hypothetical protein
VIFAFLLAFALVFASATVADGDAGGPVSTNLDNDPGLERVVPQEVCESIKNGSVRPTPPPCGENEFSRRRIVVEDSCPGGGTHQKTISSVQDTVDRFRVTEVDGKTKRPEIFFDMRSGATGRGGEIRVVRYSSSGALPCQPGKAHRLFRYPARSTLGPVPRGAAGHDGFSASLGDYGRRYAGKEIRVIETYVDRDDAFCCPSFRRITYFRFSRARDEYARYRTHVTRIKKR